MIFATAALFASTLQGVDASPGFQAYPLGMTLEQFRSMPHATARGRSIAVQCTTDAERSRFLRIDPAMQRAGVVRCWPTEEIARSRVRASFDLTPDHQGMPEFDFFDGKLYRIEVWADVEAGAAIRAGLERRFGEPSAAGDATLQNLYGATFPQQILAWSRDGVQIGLVTPAGNLRRMVVTYINRAIDAEVRRRAAADPDSTANM